MADPDPPEPFLVGYARVSSEDQELRLQTDALLKAGVHPDNIHTDRKSGADDKRPGFLACMKDLREGDVLVVWKLDRLGRRLTTLLRTLERLEQRGIGLKVLMDPIDTTTAYARQNLDRMGKGGRKALTGATRERAKAAWFDPKRSAAEVVKEFGVSRATFYNEFGLKNAPDATQKGRRR